MGSTLEAIKITLWLDQFQGMRSPNEPSEAATFAAGRFFINVIKLRPTGRQAAQRFLDKLDHRIYRLIVRIGDSGK